jgi:Peptidase E
MMNSCSGGLGLLTFYLLLFTESNVSSWAWTHHQWTSHFQPSSRRTLLESKTCHPWSNFRPQRLEVFEKEDANVMFSSQNEMMEAPEQSCELSSVKFGILISSFTESMTSTSTLEFLKYSLASLLTMDMVQMIQKDIEQSVMYSPCQGPNMELLDKLQEGDTLLLEYTDVERREEKTQSMLEFLGGRNLELRVLYIPTAMYALNPNSSNTPGKQRQRARADGKKRRNQLILGIQELFQNDVHLNLDILAVTLDFDDGSIKQPIGSQDASKFPKTGVEALTSWEPHVIYVEGGNTFWLHHCMVKGEEDWMHLIKIACCCHGLLNNNGETEASQGHRRRPALYIGKSAGAIVAGKYVETATWKGWDDPSVVPGKETYEAWKGILGMDLVGGASFFPHMSDDWVQTVQEKTRDMMLPSSDDKVICLQEADACCISIEASNQQQVLLSSPSLVDKC